MKISRCDLYKPRRRHTHEYVSHAVRTSHISGFVTNCRSALSLDGQSRAQDQRTCELRECAACTRAHAQWLLCLLSKLIKLSAARAVTQPLRFVQQAFSIKASRYGKCSLVFCCLGFSDVTGWGKGERVEAGAHTPNLAKKKLVCRCSFNLPNDVL